MSAQASMLLDLAQRRGAARADVFIKSGSTRSAARDAAGNVVWTRTAEGGVGLRIFNDAGACGFASACGTQLPAAQAGMLVDAALDAARGPGRRFDLPAGRAPDGRGLGIFDARLQTATPADLEGILDQAAGEALRTDPRVRRIDSASLTASASEVELSNSRGLTGSYRQTLMNLTLGVAASDGARSTVLRRSRTARTLASISPRLFGDETTRLAALVLDARPAATHACAALLSPSAAVTLLRAAARRLLDGDDREDTRDPVRGGPLTIVDDGRLPGGIATAPFDGEGCPTRRTPIMSSGALTGALHDLESAARAGAASTGNGVRASFREPPGRRPTNFFITPGSASPPELLARLRDGVWIQLLRPTPALSGDPQRFCALTTGCAVREGAPAEAFGPALLTGDLADLLAAVVEAGNDLTFGFPGDAFGAPSLLLESVRLQPA